MSRAAPYPPDTRAKGWRFELDMERFKESDTWLRARDAITRGLLLLLWAEAWGRRPAGSLPNDDELIAGLLGLSDEEFRARRHVLMRGWWLADDGLLYHDVLVERVREMTSRRRSDAARQANRRAKGGGGDGSPDAPPKDPPKPPFGVGSTSSSSSSASPIPSEPGGSGAWAPPPDTSHADVTRDKRVNHGGVGGESDTGTEYRIPDKSAPSATPACAREGPVDKSEEMPPDDARLLEVVRCVRDSGYPDVSVGDPVLRALVAQGLTADEAGAAAKAGKDAGRGFGWVMARIAGRRQDAAAAVLATKPAAPEPGSATPGVESTQALLASMQLTPEQRAASAAAKRRLWESRRTGAVKDQGARCG